MHRFRLSVLMAAAAMFLALGTGVSRAAPAPGPSCDPQGLWTGAFAGTLPADQGDVTFRIDANEDFDPLDVVEAEKDTNVSFKWSVVFSTNGATADGSGHLDVTSDATALFSISGRGMHPLAGSFSVDASGVVDCAAGQAVLADGDFHVKFQNGMSDDGTLFLLHGRDLPT